MKQAFLLIGMSVLVLPGCGSDDNSGNDSLGAITGDTALAVGQEATTRLTTLYDANGDLGTAWMQLDSLGSTTASVQQKGLETWACPGGGTLSVDSQETSSVLSLSYDANQCVDAAGATLHGSLRVTLGAWAEFDDGTTTGSLEMFMETGQEGLVTGQCALSGGLVFRLFIDESEHPAGANTFIYEYGTASTGFDSACNPGGSISLAGDMLLRNTLIFAVADDGSLESSNTVDFQGGFEAADGSGHVSIGAEDLEYPVTDDASSLYGVSGICPSAGELRATGSAGATVSVYFGDDAPPGYAVQVIGPDGYVGEFETCAAFLAASG